MGQLVQDVLPVCLHGVVMKLLMFLKKVVYCS